MARMTDKRLATLLSEMATHAERLRKLAQEIESGGHPNAAKLYSSLIDNGLEPLSDPCDVGFAFLSKPEKFEQSGWGIRPIVKNRRIP